MRKLAVAALAATMTLLSAACDGNSTGGASSTSETAANSAPTASAADEAAVIAALRKDAAPRPAAPSGDDALPPGHPPIDGAPMAMPRSAAPAGPAVEVRFTAPEQWVSEPPANAFRKAQYKIPAVEGDAEPAEVVIFYFGPGQGGGTAANISRWRDQFRDADGNALPDDAMKSERFKASDWNVVLVEVAGTYAAGMPGMGPGTPKPNYRMIGGVVEVPSGSYFIKATGPDATISQNRDAITEYILSAKPAA